MNELSWNERIERLEGKVDQIEQKVSGTFSTASGVSTQGHVQVLSNLGGSDPNAQAPPRRREPDFTNEPPEPPRPKPKRITQSHYGGKVDKDGKYILDDKGNVQIFKLNFADRAWGFFKSARGRLRRWSKGNRQRENRFMYLDVALRNILDELEEENDQIDTRRIMEVRQLIVEFLAPENRQHHEIDGVWKIVAFIAGLFE